MTDLDRVTRLRPDVDDPTPDWLAATRAALLERTAEPTRRRGPHRGMLVALAAGVAVLAVIALVVPATTMLAAGPRIQYLYVKQGFSDEKDGRLSLSEGWYALDSAGPVRTVRVSCTPSAGVACTGSSAGALLGPLVLRGSPPSILDWSYRQLATLPTDPTQLRAQLYDMANGIVTQQQKDAKQQVFFSTDPDEEVFSLIEGTLVKAIAPPELVTAMYQVSLTLPGVKAEPSAKDAAGRSGVGVTHEGTAYRSTLVFDRPGGRFLGLNDVDVKWPDYVPSTVILSAGLVDHLGDRL